MNSNELKKLAQSYKIVYLSIEKASNELAKIEKIMGATAPKPKAKQKANTKKTAPAPFESQLI